MRDTSDTLGELTRSQLTQLCGLYDIDSEVPGRLLTELLGPISERPLDQPPVWPSDVADDATPVEFSVAFEGDGRRKVRILGETIAEQPSTTENLKAAERFVDNVHARDGVAVDKLHSIQDLFTPEQPKGAFAWWYSTIFEPGSAPKIKVYFNPEVHGREAAPEVVEKALSRLGLSEAYSTIEKYALQRFEQDVVAFFAVDLDDSPQARVKLYISHLGGTAEDARRTAEAVPGIDYDRITEFCATLGGDTTVFDGRPLVSSYSFVDGDTDTPSNYSLYVPVRDYVPDDAVARERVLRAMSPYGPYHEELDQVTRCVTSRSLRENVGLLAHASLRMSPGSTGTTVYVSSEAYGGTP